MITHFESEISVCVCVVCSLLLSMCYKLLENPGFVRDGQGQGVWSHGLSHEEIQHGTR